MDEGFKRSRTGYTDTIILVSVSFLKRKFIMLSIPRDLWIPVSEREENRIGAVYRIAEMKKGGKGPSFVIALVNKLFQVQLTYYVLIKMQGFIDIVDSLNGVDITLLQPVAGYPAGVIHLDGQAALAFARDRAKTDDFARMGQAQILIKAIIAQVFKIQTWLKLPRVLSVLKRATETNIPFWEWFRLAFMILFLYSNGIENYAITREMVYPTITTQGKKIIKPDWNKIRSLTRKILKN